MLPQVDPAARPFRSPVFAAFYTRHIDQLRQRAVHLCTRSWDVNAAHLLLDDARALLAQSALTEPDHDDTPLRQATDFLADALARPDLPDDATRAALLAQLESLGQDRPATERRHATVRHTENDRIEVPPAGFWRRWAPDAPPPSYGAPTIADDENAPQDDFSGLGLGNIDIDAMLASGRVGSSMEIVQERVASHVDRIDIVPSAGSETGIEPPDDFITTPTAPASDDYDWSLDSSAHQDRSLDAFWQATADIGTATKQPSPSGNPTLSPLLADNPVESAVRPRLDATSPPAVPAVDPGLPPPTRPDDQAATPFTGATPPASGKRDTTPPREIPPAPTLVSGEGKRIYHLTESGELACELDQRLEQLGYELELLESADELKEVLGALTPNIVIVDAEFESSLEGIGKVLRTARQKASDPIRLLVICDADTMPARLAARRAGADALLFAPDTAMQVIGRIEQMLHIREDDRFRILIVEDDPAQGLFAESILRNAGMDAEVVSDGLKVMDAMQRFQPDLVLMDLYMPDCDGTELTALIRERDEFLHTPIVFLSGESDQDKHYEALSAGGDDFLSKPIRPKYLIATVTNRVRRARALRQRVQNPPRTEPFDSGTGLHFRSAMLERLEQALVQSEPAQRQGGVLLVAIDEVPALRQRLGLTTVEELLEDVAQFIVGQLGSGTMASRYGDACFLVFDAEAAPERLTTEAAHLREALMLHAFDTPRESVHVAVTVGTADLRLPFADAAAVLDAAERAATMPAHPQPDPVAAPPPTQDAEVAALLGDARQAGRLDMDYQPIVALQGGEQAQYQTLLRLRRPDGDALPASRVLPVARNLNRLPELDRWVLSHALEVAASRLAIAKPVTLFVNQSIETLAAPDYGQWLLAQLDGPTQPGESLVIEIDADEVGLHLESIHALCTSLLPLGVRFCLSRYRGSEDQDGILHVLPVDLVKIAPDLLARLGSSEARTRLTALVERMHERGVGVIAPRVEDTRTAATLWMSGIDYIQGNLVQLAGSSLDFDFDAAVL